jgi:anti-anti-sigma factor
MEIQTQTIGNTLVITLDGRLDAHGTQIAQRTLEMLSDASVENIVLDLNRVPYLSSAGLRFFLMVHKWCAAWEGRFALVGLQDYCREVLKIGGLEGMFAIHADLDEALAALDAREAVYETECGRFGVTPGARKSGAIEVLGRIEEVLASSITPDRVWSKAFSAKEYSLGLGALGPTTNDVMPLLGEMITIGGTMVWLPTDGNDTPDFLIPRADSETVTIRTGFNASIAGPFNEFMQFRSKSEDGATLSEIYRAVFDLAKGRRSDFRGAVGLAMRAEVSAVYGAGVRKSPIRENAPANGEWITHPSNFDEWFEFDVEPRHRGVTGLICGAGLDLTEDLSVFNQEYLHSTFYLNPANRGSATEMLHNHGVFFSGLPFPDSSTELENEIAAVVEAGDFIDMRHLLDATRVTRALIGVVYVSDFRPDSTGG